jgi:hypothetical protein
MERLGRAAAHYSIQAEVVRARNCNFGYQEGDKFILDVGVECGGYGEVRFAIKVVPRVKK